MSRPLNDDEVRQEVQKMISFIRQEAVEKARELQVKADEEFNIEKAKLVRQETVHLEATFTKKLKKVQTAQKISQSGFLNKSRLEVLSVRDEALNQIFEDARQSLASVTADETKYKTLLKDLLLQCMLELMDSNVEVECKRSESQLIASIVETAKHEYEEKTGLKVDVSISSRHLDESCSGGLVATSFNGKIRCDNTLETRLRLLSEKMLPAIRVALFGHSQNRKFFD